MSDTEDGEFDAPGGDLRVMVGDLRGRMRAHERRMDRHETWVGDKFASLESKIDGVDTKLDGITKLIAEQAGGKQMLRLLAQPAFWVIGTVGTAATWLFAHFTMSWHQ